MTSWMTLGIQAEMTGHIPDPRSHFGDKALFWYCDASSDRRRRRRSDDPQRGRCIDHALSAATCHSLAIFSASRRRRHCHWHY